VKKTWDGGRGENGGDGVLPTQEYIKSIKTKKKNQLGDQNHVNSLSATEGGPNKGEREGQNYCEKNLTYKNSPSFVDVSGDEVEKRG